MPLAAAPPTSEQILSALIAALVPNTSGAAASAPPPAIPAGHAAAGAPAVQPSRLKSFVYVDVLLPMVAVLLLVVLLLAWVG